MQKRSVSQLNSFAIVDILAIYCKGFVTVFFYFCCFRCVVAPLTVNWCDKLRLCIYSSLVVTMAQSSSVFEIWTRDRQPTDSIA